MKILLQVKYKYLKGVVSAATTGVQLLLLLAASGWSGGIFVTGSFIMKISKSKRRYKIKSHPVLDR